MMICCPCCGAGIDADADAELALEAAITELDAIRAALPDDGTDGRATLHSRVARLVAELDRNLRRVRQLRRAVLAWAYKYECLGAAEFGASLSDETCRGLYDRARDRSRDNG